MRRAGAALLAVWFVLAGVLGARHAAQVAHVLDQRTGELRHAEVAVGVHTSSQSDYHEVTRDSDHDVCAIEAALHQAARASVAPAWNLALHLRTNVVVLQPCTSPTSDAIYGFAPKTSPPVV
jgi:hypothetical protein